MVKYENEPYWPLLNNNTAKFNKIVRDKFK